MTDSINTNGASTSPTSLDETLVAAPYATTDYNDYAPGATATITAGGFAVGATIAVEVDHVSDPGPDGLYGTADDAVETLGGDGHEPWYVTDGGSGDLDGIANGTIVTSWYVNPDDSLDQTFLLTASAIDTGSDGVAGTADDVSLGQSATASFTDATEIDLRTAGSSTTVNGAVFFDSANIGAGTGNYNTILAISDNDGNERGFNSDDTPPLDASNNNIDQAKTHTVLLSTVPITIVNGVAYYEFRVDLNESNSNPNGQISLDAFKIFTSSNGGIETLAALNGQTLVYDMDAGGDKTLLLSEVSTGSGTDDYAVLVPVSNFGAADPATTYMYLYTEMGFKGGDYRSQGGFEEWNLQTAGALTGTKFNDLDGDGVRDAGEPGIQGVTIFIDADKDGVLDASERSTVTDASGNYTFFGVPLGTHQIDEVVPAGLTQTTGAFETATIGSLGQTVVVDPIGNFLPVPALNIVKDVSSVTGGSGGSADSAGDVINYAISVQNTGNVTLTGVAVTDPYADAGSLVRGADIVGDNDALLEVGETWGYTAAHTVTQAEIDGNGGGDGQLENTATADSDETGPDTDDASVPVVYDPALNIVKDVSSVTGGSGGSADSAGDVINYAISVQNTGNVTLTGVAVTDPYADAGSLVRGADIVGDNDALLEVGETWGYTAAHTVTQAEIDGNGGGDGQLENTATADSDETGPDTDDASVPVVYDPDVDITKSAAVKDGIADHAGDVIDYTVVLTNAGNVSLTGVVLRDMFEGQPVVTLDTNGSTPTTADDAVLVESVNANGILDVGESWTYTYKHILTQAELNAELAGDRSLDNVATVTTNETGPDSDDAHVPVAVGPGVRTPGFWAQTTWQKFWDGVAGNEPKQAGTNGFANSDILLPPYANPDTDGAGPDTAGKVQDPVGGAYKTGMLVGDFNLNGETDLGENTFYFSISEALKVLNASQKDDQDSRFIIARHLVSTWLNYQAGNPIEASNASVTDAKDVISWAIDWLQNRTPDETADGRGDGSLTLQSATWKTPSSSSYWGVGIDGPDAGTAVTGVSPVPQFDPTHDVPAGAALSSLLDEYNNHGSILGVQIATSA
ncbi:Mo-co oxidoreductase dimerization domain protein [Bosea sp. LC85]|uniref:DUF7507 domain-containing protein n=1 Tax=Bosea sp. LC85 TaxID=1502851 RepID=UPI0004E2E5A3|nr:SdrD B-like domain-containing protein [Bosea sp. LC85]KFC75903.1 Mo-co oxidoreductase dimerization domain protein [Bosea sp. LC85]